MSAKISLVGQPQNLSIEHDLVTFKMVAGPTASNAPKGMTLFKPVTYVVQCNQRQFNRGRAGEADHSELIIEGYQEPRLAPDGKLYIVVVALAVTSQLLQRDRKLIQLREEVTKAEEAYAEACDTFGLNAPPAQAALANFERLKANLLKFMSNRTDKNG